ncbi:MAG: ABC transporter permease [Verrucomicrobium sp.]|nr:ABC transporter permease [Verrucomicrobium sp.]
MSSGSHLTPWQLFRVRFRANRLAVASLWFLAAMLLLVVVGPWLSPYTYAVNDLKLGAHGPTVHHWLGTDMLGRDLLVRLLYGGRISFAVAALAASVALVIGVAYGAVAGYYGRWIDSGMMRVVDILSILPFTVFLILLRSFFGRDFILLFVAIGGVSWLTMARIVRGQVQALRNQEFVAAARSLGASPWRIVSRHLIPNTLGPVIAYTALMIPSVMMAEAFLSFIGLGVQPPMSSWGSLINAGIHGMEEYPWLIVFPCVAFAGTLLAFNFLGDGLRDALDPRSSGR